MKKGDNILVPFYFTGHSNYKLRPSLIVSYGQSNLSDFIVAFISTIIRSTEAIHETYFVVDSSKDHFNKTVSKKTSTLQADQLMMINKSIVADREDHQLIF